jgi:hypothetical protein
VGESSFLFCGFRRGERAPFRLPYPPRSCTSSVDVGLFFLSFRLLLFCCTITDLFYTRSVIKNST